MCFVIISIIINIIYFYIYKLISVFVSLTRIPSLTPATHSLNTSALSHYLKKKEIMRLWFQKIKWSIRFLNLGWPICPQSSTEFTSKILFSIFYILSVAINLLVLLRSVFFSLFMNNF